MFIGLIKVDKIINAFTKRIFLVNVVNVYYVCAVFGTNYVATRKDYWL